MYLPEPTAQPLAPQLENAKAASKLAEVDRPSTLGAREDQLRLLARPVKPNQLAAGVVARVRACHRRLADDRVSSEVRRFAETELRRFAESHISSEVRRFADERIAGELAPIRESVAEIRRENASLAKWNRTIEAEVRGAAEESEAIAAEMAKMRAEEEANVVRALAEVRSEMQGVKADVQRQVTARACIF